MSFIDEKIGTLVTYITRPRRNVYTMEQMGPSHFRRGNRSYIRKDIEIVYKKRIEDQYKEQEASETSKRTENSNYLIECSLYTDKHAPS